MIFDMHQIGKTIACLRRKHNMTQMQMADEMNVSFQAVSNWERGQSMPDISKLPELAELFSVSIDELLGRHSPVVEKVAAGKLDELTSVTVDELAEAAPLLPPQQLDGLADRLLKPAATKNTHALPDLKELLPYLSTEKVDLCFRQKAASGDGTLHEYAMFASTEAIDEVVQTLAAQGQSISALIPFMSEEAVDTLARDAERRDESITHLLPFLYEDTIGEIAIARFTAGRGYTEMLPFMNQDAVEAIAHAAEQRGESITHLLPFLSEDSIEEIAKARIAAGRKISAMLPFLSEEFIGSLFDANL